MKKIIPLLFIFLPLLSYNQVTMESVLIEVGTATWSAACSNEAQLIEQMKTDGYQVSVINYHLNDPYSNNFANQRAAYYQIQNVPYPIIGGDGIEAGDYDSYINAYLQAFNKPSSFTITAIGEFIEDSLYLEFGITKVADYESDSISLLIALTESNINEEWQGMTELQDVERSSTTTTTATTVYTCMDHRPREP